MCGYKSEAKTKMDRLIEAIDRLSSLLELISQDTPARDQFATQPKRNAHGTPTI